MVWTSADTGPPSAPPACRGGAPVEGSLPEPPWDGSSPRNPQGCQGWDRRWLEGLPGGPQSHFGPGRSAARLQVSSQKCFRIGVTGPHVSSQKCFQTGVIFACAFVLFFFSCFISSKRLCPTAFLLWQQGHGCLQNTAFLHHQRTSKGKQPPEPPANPTSTANILEESLLNILEAGHRAPRLFWGQEMEAGQGAGSPDGGNWPRRGLRKRNESWQLGQGGETKPLVPTGETCFQSRSGANHCRGIFL